MGTPVVIDTDFVRSWSGRYPLSDRERALFAEDRPRVAARGFFVRAEFLAVGRWKSARASSRLAANSDEDIEDLTGVALAAPDRLKHRILDLLQGVGVPMASALLTVWNPTVFTIIDVRAIETLRAAGQLGGGRTRYMPYLERCRELADGAGCDLRTLDRALWMWSKERGSVEDSDGLETAWTGDEGL